MNISEGMGISKERVLEIACTLYNILNQKNEVIADLMAIDRAFPAGNEKVWATYMYSRHAADMIKEGVWVQPKGL